MSGNRAKLVRARPKAVEDLPEWAKCCEQFTAVLMAIGEITVDVSDLDAPASRTLGCAFCGSVLPISKGVPDVADGLFIPLECFDIDETGVANGNYVEGPVNL